MFGYENVTVQQAGYRDIIFGDNEMLLGSNTSGSYNTPNYSSLVPSGGSVSPFAATSLHTLLDIDLSDSNESISTFNLALESSSTLSLRNITTVLVNQTVSSRLADCQPVSDPTTVPFGLYGQGDDQPFITGAWQDLPSSTIPGVVNRFAEELEMKYSFFSASSYPSFTFLMTLADNMTTRPTPADESQVFIVLAFLGECTSDPVETAFGPMPQVSSQMASILNATNRTFPHSHATLACRNVRTISRTIYSPAGAEIAHTSESFYAKPVLSTVNQLYMYNPVETKYRRIAVYSGTGSLLNHNLMRSSAWRLANCWGGTNSTSVNSTENRAISSAWSEAAAQVQHYESTVLEAFVK
ncbi:hypothetical protein FRC07_007002 [Ceratobasidium sp. 392]|nr:hypothetical protein FRC07_007002 [Ceratobasidium sp. 392]